MKGTTLLVMVLVVVVTILVVGVKSGSGTATTTISPLPTPSPAPRPTPTESGARATADAMIRAGAGLRATGDADYARAADLERQSQQILLAQRVAQVTATAEELLARATSRSALLAQELDENQRRVNATSTRNAEIDATRDAIRDQKLVEEAKWVVAVSTVSGIARMMPYIVIIALSAGTALILVRLSLAHNPLATMATAVASAKQALVLRPNAGIRAGTNADTNADTNAGNTHEITMQVILEFLNYAKAAGSLGLHAVRDAGWQSGYSRWRRIISYLQSQGMVWIISGAAEPRPEYQSISGLIAHLTNPLPTPMGGGGNGSCTASSAVQETVQTPPVGGEE